MKFSHTTSIYLSGAIWLLVGVFLLQTGLNLVVASLAQRHPPLLTLLQDPLGGRQEAAVVVVAIAIYLGFLKGKHLLSKSAKRVVAGIRTQPNPVPIQNIYSGKYYMLIAAMIGLGISIKYLGLSNDIRGTVDTAIGAALINGSLTYFQLARSDSSKEKKKGKKKAR